MTADRVDLVDEDYAWSVLLALLKQIAHAACADADKHLDEVRPGDRKERDVSFAGDRTGKQRLACTGRAHHQDALGDSPTQLLKLLRFFQELYNLLQLFLRFFDAGHVFEGHPLLLIA